MVFSLLLPACVCACLYIIHSLVYNFISIICFCFMAVLVISNCLLNLVAELYTKRMFELLLLAYSTISIQDTALFLGMNEDDATNCKLPSSCLTWNTKA